MSFIRKATVTVAASLLALTGAALSAGTASAQGAVNVGAGQSYNTSGGLGCTIGAVGTNSWGQSVALTAGHCGGVGTRAYVGGVDIGGFTASVHSKTEGFNLPLVSMVKFNVLDYAVIELNSNAIPAHVSGLPRLNGINGNPGPLQQVCKQGRTTGITCGSHLVSIARENVSTMHIDFGDSGSGAQSGDKLVGIVSRMAWNPSGFAVIQSIDSIRADAAARGNSATGFWPNS